MDFVTLFYNNNIDIKLLEIQAFSFKYVNDEVCNNIILFFNSNDDIENILFRKYVYNTLINIYPAQFKNRIHFYTKKDFDIDCKNTWTSQQLLKLIISNKINTEYYCVLDTKIHFIKEVTINDFFNLKPKLYYNKKTHLNPKFIKSINLFNDQTTINTFFDLNIYEFSTICPFIFKTEYVKQLIGYIPNFNLFFLLNNEITEFFLYISFIIKINKINDYEITNENNLSFIFFNHMKTITQEKILGIHYKFVLCESNEKKETLLKYYENTELYDYIKELLNIQNSQFYLDDKTI